MSRDQTTEPLSLSATQAEQVDRACDRFEDELWAGRGPSIEAYLDAAEGPVRSDLLRKLLDLEIAWRLDADERPARGEYLGRFPDAAAAIEAAFPTETQDFGGDGGQTETLVPTPDVVLGDRYRLLKVVGGDGMGIIWVARDERLHREVALKEIRPDFANSPEVRARFLRETKVTAKLDHPGVVTVHDLGARAGGDPFYVMHLVRGEDLRKALRKLHGLEAVAEDDPAGGPGRTPPRLDLHALVGRLVDACYAVAYAHRRRVIHRDLKPSNIMLGPFGETYVIDWGLTKRQERPGGAGREAEAEPSIATEGEVDHTPTALGSGPGTLGYMPPEQLRGDPSHVGPASDIFSLGATLYSLLTGHRPFTGTKSVMIEKTLACDFPPPRQVKPTVPRPLEAICLKAMASRPEDRYGSAKALAEDLERWLADEPVLAHREPAAVRLARWSRRHRTAVVAAAVLLATSTLALAVFGARVEAARKAAEANFLAADDAVQQMLKAAEGPDLAYLPGAESLRARQVVATIGLRRRLLAARPGDPKARFDLAHALRTSAAIDDLSGPTADADGRRREAIDLLVPLAAEHPEPPDYRIELARARIDAADSLRLLGRPREAEPLYREALDTLGPPPEGPGGRIVALFTTMALFGGAQARAETGRFAESRRDADRAVALVLPLADDPRAQTYDRFVIAHALIARAEAARGLGDPTSARKDLAEAARRERELIAARPGNADARFAFAQARLDFARIAAESGGPPADVAAALRDALPHLADLSNQFPRINAYRRALSDALIVRGGNQLAAGRLDLAEKDGADAARYLGAIAKDVPDVPDYQGLLARAHELLARVAIARKKPADARARSLEAIRCVDAARRANPEHPEVRATLARCRDLLQGLESTPGAGVSPR